MTISNIEIVGIALIVVGIVFIYFTRTGRFSDKDTGGEISSKIFTLKGGTGLVLVALGAILLVLGGGSQIQDPPQISTTLPQTSTTPTTLTTPAPITSPMPTTTIITIPAPTTPTPPTTQPPEYYTYPTEITREYLIGTWSSSQGAITETIIFYQDGTFYLENFNTFTGETLSLNGVYEPVDLGVYFYYTGGTPQYYQITYIDEDTFKIDADIYTRVW